VDLNEDLGVVAELMNPLEDFVPPPPEDIYSKKMKPY
jgi:hypothetical protein